MNAAAIDPTLAKFRARVFHHVALDEALQSTLAYVANARPESIIALLGPSGVGKSTVVAAIERHFRKHYAERIATDPGFLPYITINAPTPLDGHFSWRDFFSRTLATAGEVLVHRKVASPHEILLDGRTLPTIKGLVRDELRRSLEALVAHRGVPLIIVDEASAILRLKRGSVPAIQFEVLKSLAVELRIPILLVGAYDLLGILEGNGQLMRRTLIVHFRRYAANRGTHRRQDWEDFADVLNAFLRAIDIEQESGLIDSHEYFMMNSIGCAGVLKDWLDRALIHALRNPTSNGPLLSRAAIQATMLPTRRLVRLASEATAGEKLLADEEQGNLATLLGLDHTPSLELGTSEAEQRSARSATRKRPGGRAAQRGPSRDPVGVPHAK